jgi:predicted MPP superfamily phosphohydrolase
MLSGHTHGGQINLPRLGRVTLGRNGKRFAAGMYRHAGTYLYVHKGVGFGFRIRYGVRPEVAVLELRPVANGASAPPSVNGAAGP